MKKRIKVYIGNASELENVELFNKLYSLASSERQIKINRLSFDKDKRLSLAVEILLKKALNDFGITDYELCFGERGKPYLKGREDLFFNLSHSGERVMCAVSSEEVGCDVEKVKEIDLRVAKRFFYSTEYNSIIEKETTKEQTEMFFRMWTLKESFMKVTGLGIKLPIDSFRIDINNGIISVYQTLNDKKYYFKEYSLDDEYKYAVCGLVSEFDEPEIVKFGCDII